ncbi:PQQ-dependent sugar dehydrogenase [Rhodococcus sp. NPDC058521]|uniref:PQQ-dependent sugar dehydrogenase n=1 Tax=Rhodococcus sp. NPDC058521 TaxID=3346536 RepID=UPI003664279F
MTVGGWRKATRNKSVVSLAAFGVTAALVSGCAQFDESASSPFSPEPSEAPVDVHPESEAPETTSPEPPRGPLGPCEDPDPAVVATCLDSTGGLVTLPGGTTAIVAERRSGRILEVTQGQEPREIAHVDVDGGSGGGLLDIALSPTFAEDNLIYAYATSGSDNRIVRIAPGDSAKEILSGIPRGESGNSGSLEFSSPTDLMVLTGDGGDPAAAANPASLAGKLLKVTALSPAPAGAQPPPQVVLSGIGTAGGVCVDPGIATWVTDRTALEDRLQRVGADGSVTSPVWTWPEHPGVGGCVAAEGVVAVSLDEGKALSALAADPTGAVSAAPSVVAKDRYGRLNGAALGEDGQIWVGTVNKDGGEPGPNDDRVVKMPLPSGGGGFD